MEPILAQPEGGELIEVLVLLIIMALSALGSVLKGRKGGKKKLPPARRPKRPAEANPIPGEIRDASRIPEPYDLRQAGEIESAPPPQAVAGPRPAISVRESTESREETRRPMAEGDLLSGKVPESIPALAYDLGELGLDDLRKAIILKEVLGAPRALDAYGNAS
jgi:hypothetical protein